MNIPPGYEDFFQVLVDALNQSAIEKGHERHGDGRAFKDQVLMTECEYQKGPGFPIGQARKKALESMRLKPGDAYQEILGGIVYLVGAALWYKKQDEVDVIENGFDLVAQKKDIWPGDKGYTEDGKEMSSKI